MTRKTMTEAVGLRDVLLQEFRPLTNYEQVLAFHDRFNLPQPAVPRMLSEADAEYRIKFMNEELMEYEEAIANGDLEAAFDALIDLAYVVLGTAIWHGFPWEAGFNEVQRANMAKVPVRSADESKRGHALDIKKPEGWRPPDLLRVLDHWVRERSHDDHS